MSYTVRQLEQLSGVTARTLHWYDQIGLLPPAHLGTGGRRYYEREQLIRLQQILFFRQLGFSLADIADLLEGSRMQTVALLRTHRFNLEQRLEQTKELIETIDQTIQQMEKERPMNEKQFFKGFASEPNLAVYQGSDAEKVVVEASKRAGESDKEKVGREADALFEQLFALFQNKESERSDAVQKIVAAHHDLLGAAFGREKELYLAYATLYIDHPNFRAYFDQKGQGFADWVAAAMQIYIGELR